MKEDNARELLRRLIRSAQTRLRTALRQEDTEEQPRKPTAVPLVSTAEPTVRETQAATTDPRAQRAGEEPDIERAETETERPEEELAAALQQWREEPPLPVPQDSRAEQAQQEAARQVVLGMLSAQVSRAVRPAAAPAAAAQHSAGMESVPVRYEQAGHSDAAALSRLYERDARRYDGCFELPL